MINFFTPPPAPPSPEMDLLRYRYAVALNSLRDLERYYNALVAIRDHSTDVAAVALANNVLMGLPTDFGFFYFPAKPKHQ